jgi:hypothetical protein
MGRETGRGRTENMSRKKKGHPENKSGRLRLWQLDAGTVSEMEQRKEKAWLRESRKR